VADGELYDPYSDEVRADPYGVYRRLRDERPLYRNERRGFWALSRFDDVRAVLADWETYTTTQGSYLQRPESGTAFLPMMVTMDPPRHTKLRALVSRAFTPRLVAELEPAVRRTAAELVDAFVQRGTADLATELAGPLPTAVIADLLGVPRADLPAFRRWSDALIQAGDPEAVEAQAAAAAASAELYAYFGALIDERRAAPVAAGDLVGSLLAASVDGEQLGRDELLGFCFLLLVAGNETTANLIANGALALAAHPDQRAEVAADPSLVPGAVEECLRFDSPITSMGRLVTRDVEWYGRSVPAGDRILVVFGAAHRDERAFEDPDRFDVHRRLPHQLGFGHGIHSCLGAALARLEARAAFEQLLGRLPDYAVCGPVERLRSGPVRGVTHVPIAFTPGDRHPPGG
jgi:cytochrome P450